MSKAPIVVLGAGPAGLGAALQLARRRTFNVSVLERGASVGGNAGSFELDGVPVDFGSHRLHPACPPQIISDIRMMLGSDLQVRPRHGRIRLRGKWLHFPLKPVDLLRSLPFSFAAGVMSDMVRKRIAPVRHGEESFASVLEQGLGRTICRDFYFPYAKKIWGVDAASLDAEQARRRVGASSVGKMIRKVANAVPGLKRNGHGTFFYPRGGFGRISQAYRQAAVEQGAIVELNSHVRSIALDDRRVAGLCVKGEAGDRAIAAKHLLSTIPLPALVGLLRPAAPDDLLASIERLEFRAMILVYLVLDADRFTEYDAHYFPDAAIPITRLSEPKNYGLADCPGTTVLCAELPCSKNDDAWTASEERLGELVRGALDAAGLPLKSRVRRVEVRRLPQAYPIYTKGYRDAFDRADRWLAGIEGLVTFGRQGLFAHDNTHHTLAMAYAVSDCVTDTGFDRQRWAAYRTAFESHVVED